MAIQEVTIAGNQARVALQGSIYVEESAEIMRKLKSLIDEGHTSFLIDFTDVDYIDSAGIGTLAAIHNRVRKRDGGVVIQGLNGLVMDMFMLTRAEKVFDMV